jgi:hypothetical protein
MLDGSQSYIGDGYNKGAGGDKFHVVEVGLG